MELSKCIVNKLKTLANRLGMLVIGVLAFFATTIVLDMFLGLDGRAVQGDAVIIASSVLVGAAMLTRPVCQTCTAE